tara:strand:+ start:793 stop:1869 length:1077 start_codon:yes stop_codon:yes gene_type:complete
MSPNIQITNTENGILNFTLTGVNYSFANAIRRTILSDINTVVFRTFPYEENKASFIKNTTRFTNEILKQRLSCIPIHITDLDPEYISNLQLVIEEENNTDRIKYITTEDFKIKDKQTDRFISREDVSRIFPPNSISNQYIDFARLMPSFTNDTNSEKLYVTCDFDIGNAGEDGMFNVTSTCSYSNTPDQNAINEKLYSEEFKSKSELEIHNWEKLNSQKMFIDDSFDFIIESVGVFSNKYIVKKALEVLISSVTEQMENLQILESKNTLEHSHVIRLFNEDYTIGKIIEAILFEKYFNNPSEPVTFCSFKKNHPHDPDSEILIAFDHPMSTNDINNLLLNVKTEIIHILESIANSFPE